MKKSVKLAALLGGWEILSGKLSREILTRSRGTDKSLQISGLGIRTESQPSNVGISSEGKAVEAHRSMAEGLVEKPSLP